MGLITDVEELLAMAWVFDCATVAIDRKRQKLPVKFSRDDFAIKRVLGLVDMIVRSQRDEKGTALFWPNPWINIPIQSPESFGRAKEILGNLNSATDDDLRFVQVVFISVAQELESQADKYRQLEE